MKLQDKELEKIICYKLGQFGNYELQDEDLLHVEELNVSNRTFSGKEKKIDLAEVSRLENLVSISLQYFNIDDDIMKMLSTFKRLKSISLASCRLDIKTPFINPSLESISLECCDVKDYSKIFAPESFRVVGDQGFHLEDLKGKENVKRMYLQQCIVKGFKNIKNYPSLQLLNLDGSKIDDERLLEELKGRIQVSKEDDFLPIK